MELKQFIVWTGLAPSVPTYYYTDKNVSLMTKNFSEATIFDSDLDAWKLAHNPKVGRFKVYGATKKEIFKWKLKNKVPRDRL